MAIELKITRLNPYYNNNLWFVDQDLGIRHLLASRVYNRQRGELVKIARKYMQSIGGRWYDRMSIHEKNPLAIRLKS